jgi:hypothetical protein
MAEEELNGFSWVGIAKSYVHSGRGWISGGIPLTQLDRQHKPSSSGKMIQQSVGQIDERFR